MMELLKQTVEPCLEKKCVIYWRFLQLLGGQVKRESAITSTALINV
jgi:hypothetical protein